MRTKTTETWFLSLLLSCIPLPVCGQSQAPEKIAQDKTAASPIFHVGGDVTAPKAIYTPEPEFSEAARKAGYSGTCVLSATVGTDGRPTDIRVVRKLGMQLDEQAIQSLREWKFQPAQKSGRPVAVAIEVEFTFHLDRNTSIRRPSSAEQFAQMNERRSQIFRISGDEEPSTCSASSSDRHGPGATIAELILEGDFRMPSVDRDRIVASIKEQTYFGSEDQIAAEVSERLQRAWQNVGYFAAQANAQARVLTSSPSSERIAISARIEEGQQYRLEGIRFTNNRPISDVQYLRSLFKLKDGDLFDRAAVAEGLENLRRAYGEYGYANLKSVPDTRFNEGDQTISLDIMLDVGEQFYVSRVNIIGLDESVFQNVVKELPMMPGGIYNARLVELFQLREASLVPSDAPTPPRFSLQMDEKAGTLVLLFDFRRCSDH